MIDRLVFWFLFRRIDGNRYRPRVVLPLAVFMALLLLPRACMSR